MSALYELRDVIQRYEERVILNLPHLDVPTGIILGLAGPNGGGKSTLMRLFAFLETPVSGEVRFDGRPTLGREIELRKIVTYFPQEPYLLKRSVRANIGYGLSIRGLSDVNARVNEALTQVGLDPDKFAGRSWMQLSGGEVKRVALAARLALRPRVLLLDEPTANLDRASAELVRQAVFTARERHGTTLVISGHDHPWLQAICDDIMWLRDGMLSEPMTPDGHEAARTAWAATTTEGKDAS